MEYSDISVVIQGNIHSNILKSIEYCNKFIPGSNIIVSTWCGNSVSDIKNCRIVLNPLVSPDRFYNSQNLYFQISSTLNGLEQISTEYCLKLRCDEYYEKVNIIFDSMLAYPDRITTGNLFFRNYDKHIYHISDHIIGGKTSNLKRMFSSAKKTCERSPERNYILTTPENTLGICAEQILMESYLFDIFQSTRPYNPHIFYNNTSVINVLELGDFKCTSSSIKSISNIEYNTDIVWGNGIPNTKFNNPEQSKPIVQKVFVPPPQPIIVESPPSPSKQYHTVKTKTIKKRIESDKIPSKPVKNVINKNITTREIINK